MGDAPGESSPAFLARLRAGDGAAFEALVTGYQHRVFAVAARMLGDRAEAEDVAQEVFVRAHRALPAFRGDAKLSTWLYTITSRLCLSRLGRSERRLARQGEDALGRLPDPAAHPAAALERGEREAALRRAIAELPDERRMVVVLRDVEGLSYVRGARRSRRPTCGAGSRRRAGRPRSGPSTTSSRGSAAPASAAAPDQARGRT